MRGGDERQPGNASRVSGCLPHGARRGGLALPRRLHRSRVFCLWMDWLYSGIVSPLKYSSRAYLVLSTAYVLDEEKFQAQDGK